MRVIFNIPDETIDEVLNRISPSCSDEEMEEYRTLLYGCESIEIPTNTNDDLFNKAVKAYFPGFTAWALCLLEGRKEIEEMTNGQDRRR